MEGPIDDTVSKPPDLAKAVSKKNGEPQKPPGGKALDRLLQFLEERGYNDVAAVAVENAVTAEQVDQVRERAKQLGVSPRDRSEVKGREGARSSRKRTTEKETGEEGEAGAAKAEASSIAQASMTETAQAGLLTGPPTGPPTPTGPQWRSLGPWTIPNGQTYGASRVNVSGRISAVAVAPNNAAHVLAGAANGGVWESFDRGASWAPRTDYQTTLAVGAITFDRSNPAIVYCGTGEGNWWSFLGAGILKSTNGGTTWSTLCTAPFVGQGFYDLVVNPANGSHLLAATNSGLYTSTDGGVTWTQRRSQATWAISMAPAGGASAEILAACADGLFRSTNGGTTWTAVALPGSPGGFNR